jgi:hypothetical protein
MAVVRVDGAESLRGRLAPAAKLAGIGPVLRGQAEALAAAARATLEERRVNSELAKSVEIIPESQGDSLRYAIGTGAPLGRHLEFGTRRTRASPWLGPALHAYLPAINHALRKLVTGALKALGNADPGFL